MEDLAIFQPVPLKHQLALGACSHVSVHTFGRFQSALPARCHGVLVLAQMIFEVVDRLTACCPAIRAAINKAGWQR